MARSKPSGAMPHSFRGKLLLNQSTTRVTPHVLFLGTRGVSLISHFGREHAQITGRDRCQSNLVVVPTPMLVYRPGQIVTKKVCRDRVFFPRGGGQA
jgi:hypothetical protein